MNVAMQPFSTIKLYLYPSSTIKPEHRANIYKEIIKYIMITRRDLITQRYAKGGCMKVGRGEYKIKWGGYVEEEYCE